MGQTRSKFYDDYEPHSNETGSLSLHDFNYVRRENSRKNQNVREVEEPFPASPNTYDRFHVERGAIEKTKKPLLFPTVFVWPHGGKEVLIVGSYDKWATQQRMFKSENDFSLIIDLPCGKHEYAFIVDGKRRINSKNFTNETEKGVNNVIVVNPPQTNSAPEKMDIEYGQAVLDSALYLSEPPLLPPHMSCILEQSLQRGFDPAALPIPQHVTVNHMYCSDGCHRNVKALAVTQRFRSKFVTTTIYRPSVSEGSE